MNIKLNKIFRNISKNTWVYIGCSACHKVWLIFTVVYSSGSLFSDWQRAGRSGDRTPVGAWFSAPVQASPGVHPASCTMGTESFPGVKSGRGVTLTPHPLLVPWSWKSRAIPLLPLWGARPVQSLSACTRVTFTLYSSETFEPATLNQTAQHHIPEHITLRKCTSCLTFQYMAWNTHLKQSQSRIFPCSQPCQLLNTFKARQPCSQLNDFQTVQLYI
jgi:hypothetical protein